MSYGFIAENVAHFPVQVLCDVLGVSRSGYYALAKRPESARSLGDTALAGAIRNAHAASRGRYGSPRVHAELRAQGRQVGRKRVARLMRGMGLAARRRRRFRRTTDSRHGFARRRRHSAIGYLTPEQMAATVQAADLAA